MSDEKLSYSYDFWFHNPDQGFMDSWNNGGEDYYVNFFYEDIVANLNIPDEGYIVVLGTYKCVSFEKLCKIYGEDRCIGYDLHNPSQHPRVITKDCMLLSETDDIPIAFCHNDLGSFSLTPQLKTHGQKWAARNMVPGGYFLGNNNYNRSKIDVESIMLNAGMKNTHLKDLNPHKFDLSRLRQWAVDCSRNSEDRLESYMLSRKKE
jgi:hypothetical protein